LHNNIGHDSRQRYTHIHALIHTYVYWHILAYTHICIHTYRETYNHVCMHTYMACIHTTILTYCETHITEHTKPGRQYTYITTYGHTHIHTHTYIKPCSHTCIHIHASTQTYTNPYMCTYTYTYILRNAHIEISRQSRNTHTGAYNQHTQAVIQNIHTIMCACIHTWRAYIQQYSHTVRHT